MIAPSARIRFRLLGTLEVWTGQDSARIGAAKQRALLAALLLHPGQPVSTDTLIDEVWPDGPPARASNVISVHIYHLRRLIGDAEGQVLVTRAPGYQVVLQPGELDADLFARRAAEGRQALAAAEPERAVTVLTEALELWRGQALADVPHTEQITDEADRLEEARIEARELLAEATMACGRPAQAVPDLRRLVSAWPLRESAWALLMRALFGAGRPAEALEAFEQARTKLADELGVDPGHDLQQLFQQILRADGDQAATILAPMAGRPVPAPVPAQLPADIVDFTGRAEQVSQLRGLLAGAEADGTPGAVRMALVVGAAGLGKTALAVHVAHLLAGEFPDGQLYANLHGVTQAADASEVLAQFLRAMGADDAHIPLGEEERAAHYRTRLAGKRLLIVLDDARDAAQVRPLLPGSASCAVLVTARRRLPGLAGIKILGLDTFPLDEARTLFDKVAGPERAVAEPEAADDVLVACAGLPLAIRIAAARLAARSSWTVRTMADRLADERKRLDVLRVGDLGVRASFEVSFADLPGPDIAGGVDPAKAFRMLGLWPGRSVSVAAAAALLGEPEDAVTDALDVLADAHLVETPAPDRYRFHDLLRVYAADRARTQEGEADRLEAITRVLTWFLYTAEAAARVISTQRRQVPLEPVPPSLHPLEFGAAGMAVAWCETERSELAAATQLAATSGLHELAWKLPAAAMIFYRRRSHWADWVATHEIGLASARTTGDKFAEAWMLNNLGMAYGVQRMPQSVTCFEQALAISRELGNGPGEAQAATNVANAYFQLGDYSEALNAAQRSIEIEQRVGNQFGEGIALGILGGASRELGQFSDAIGYLQQALSISRELGDRDLEAETLADLGAAFLGLGQVTDAIGRFEDSLVIWESIGDRHGQAATLHKLGRAQASAGNAEKSRELLAAALALYEDLQDHNQAEEVRKALAATTAGDA